MTMPDSAYDRGIAAPDIEEIYRTMFETSRDAIMLLDRAHFQDCNQVTLRMFGLDTKEQFCRKHPADLSPPIQADGRDSFSAAMERIEAAFVSGSQFFEWLHQRADGTIFPAEVLLSRVDLHGRSLLQATVRDVTERVQAQDELQKYRGHLEEIVEERVRDLKEANKKLQSVMADRERAEDALRESEKRFRAIADYTYDWENWVGTDGRLLWVNSAVERMTGYSPQEVMAMTDFPMPLIHEDDRPVIHRIAREAIQSRTTGENIEFRIRRKDGRVVWGAVAWQPIFDEQGQWLGHRTSIREITDRKLAEEETRARTEEVAALNSLGRSVSSSLSIETVVARLALPDRQGRPARPDLPVPARRAAVDPRRR